MMPEKYRDILYKPYMPSQKYPKMDRINRAAQFSPFAALVGYDAMIDETNRKTEEWTELNDEKDSFLDRKLNYLLSLEKEKPTVTVTYFVADKKKEGGKYEKATKQLRRIDLPLRKIIFTDRTELSFDVITDFEGEIFDGYPIE